MSEAGPDVTGAGVAARLGEVRARIDALAGGRSVQIVAVTKGFDRSAIEVAVAAGCRHLGENYADELVAKAAAFAHHGGDDGFSPGTPATRPGTSAAGPGQAVQWHYLGAVQRRKVRALAPSVSLWQAVARVEEGVEIAGRAPGAGVLVQVNLSGDPHRNGCPWGTAPTLVDALRELPLDVRGLMGVAGPDDPRSQFRRLAGAAAGAGLDVVSMGMSGDFEMAVEEGSTMVRLGTALFGPRPGTGPVRR